MDNSEIAASYLRFVLHGETDGILMAKKRPASLAVDVPHVREVRDLLSVMANHGTCKVRLTGDDPMLRQDLPELISMASGIDGISEVALTTRGIGMQGRVSELAEAGLRSVNFALDTLKQARYREITGKDAFESVWAALQECLVAGLRVKVNCVLSGINEDELDDFVALTADQPVEVRFIEWDISTGRVAPPEQFLPTWEVLSRIKPSLTPRDPEPFDGPALRFAIPGHLACIGFIPNVTEHFCGECDRIGLSDFGEISSCIFGSGLNLLRLLRSPGAMDSVDVFVERVLRRKRSLAAKLSGWESAPVSLAVTSAP